MTTISQWKLYLHVYTNKHIHEYLCMPAMLQQMGAKLSLTNDTDIVVIAVSVLPHMQDNGVDALWTAFGHGVGIKWIPTHELLNAIARASVIMYSMHSLDEM